MIVQGDLSRSPEVARLFAAADAVGGCDLLVNNAATFERKPLLEIDDAHWRQMIDLNLSAPFYCCRAAVEGATQFPNRQRLHMQGRLRQRRQANGTYIVYKTLTHNDMRKPRQGRYLCRTQTKRDPKLRQERHIPPSAWYAIGFGSAP